ncbi:SprT-like domain-containing protein [Glutamicibacter sp. X7]
MPAYPTTVDFLTDDDLPVRIVRSTRRTKTISSQWRDDRLVVQVPAGLSEFAEKRMVEEMIGKFRQRQARNQAQVSGPSLEERAALLDAQYLDGRARPVSVRWVDNQAKRWGSASLKERRIRLSSALKWSPQWVQDFVLVHELVHLVVPDDGHGPKFKALLARYPKSHEADIFLRGFSTGYRAHSLELGQTPTTPEISDDPDDIDF